MEEQDWIFRAAHAERGPGTLELLDENQRQRVLAKARRAKFIHQPRRQADCGRFGQGHARRRSWSLATLRRSIHQDGPAHKALMSIKEGIGGSNGFGTVAVMKNAP